jgi:hypothetical protein
VNPGDVIGLGSARFILDTGSWRQDESTYIEPEFVSDQSLVPLVAATEVSQPTFPTSPAEPHGLAENAWRLAVLMLQAPVLAILIAIALGGSPAPVLCSLGLAAVWFGLSDALLGRVVTTSILSEGMTSTGAPPLMTRLLVLAAFCVVQCLLTWAIVAGASGLHGEALPSLGLLVLASAVGLALGLVIMALDPAGKLTPIALPVALLLLWLLGGQVIPLFRLPPVLPGFVPSRWTFEGLLLLESAQRGEIARAEDPHAAPIKDPADYYFPIDSERMGVKADVLALGAMLIGLAGTAGFISWAARPER